MIDSSASYLRIYLAPIAAYLEDDEVTDVYVNRSGELWVERVGGKTECIAVPALSDALLWRLARQIASLTHQGISREHPLLSARLPEGARIQIVAPPATRGSMILAIRRHLAADLRLSDYETAGAFSATTTGNKKDATSRDLENAYASSDWARFLRFAITGRKTILISGGTSTGKTTFLNALIREISESERLILIEDTPELVLRHPNAAGLIAVRGVLGETQVSAEDLLIASLRLRPDRIILGELRGAEALTFLRAINTGHPGSLTTIHADTPDRAIEQLGMLALQAGSGMTHKELTDYADRIIDVVVQLERRADKRVVACVRWTR